MSERPAAGRWPAHLPPDPAHDLRTRCSACGRDWNVHAVLGGYALRCDCGSYVTVPSKERDALPTLTGRSLATREALDERVLPGATAAARTSAPNISPDRPLSATAVLPDGALRSVDGSSRDRLLNRGLLELVFMVSAFWVPALVIDLTTEGTLRALLMPLSGVVSGLVVLLIGLGSIPLAFGGLRSTSPRYLVEGVGAGLGLAFLAVGWTRLGEVSGWEIDPFVESLRLLGAPMALFTVAVLPAVFEEIAFRGLLQARLRPLFGRVLGGLLTAVGFALAHGVTTGLPFHFGIGLYLCYLRENSRSLYPCMLLHFVYNATIVLWIVYEG